MAALPHRQWEVQDGVIAPDVVWQLTCWERQNMIIKVTIRTFSYLTLLT